MAIVSVFDQVDAFIQSLVNSFDVAANGNFLPFDKYVLRRSLIRCGMRCYPEVAGPAEGVRAAGDVHCDCCGCVYREHPLDWRLLGYGDVPFLHVLCDGRRVKL